MSFPCERSERRSGPDGGNQHAYTEPGTRGAPDPKHGRREPNDLAGGRPSHPPSVPPAREEGDSIPNARADDAVGGAVGPAGRRGPMPHGERAGGAHGRLEGRQGGEDPGRERAVRVVRRVVQRDEERAAAQSPTTDDATRKPRDTGPDARRGPDGARSHDVATARLRPRPDELASMVSPFSGTVIVTFVGNWPASPSYAALMAATGGDALSLPSQWSTLTATPLTGGPDQPISMRCRVVTRLLLASLGTRPSAL